MMPMQVSMCESPERHRILVPKVSLMVMPMQVPMCESAESHRKLVPQVSLMMLRLQVSMYESPECRCIFGTTSELDDDATAGLNVQMPGVNELIGCDGGRIVHGEIIPGQIVHGEITPDALTLMGRGRVGGLPRPCDEGDFTLSARRLLQLASTPARNTVPLIVVRLLKSDAWAVSPRRGLRRHPSKARSEHTLEY